MCQLIETTSDNNLIECDNCSQLSMPETILENSTNYYCTNCAVNCCECSQAVELGEVKTNDLTNDNYCNNCYNDTFSYCDCCNSDAFTDDCTYFDDQMYCESCANSHLTCCDCCRETCLSDSTTRYNSEDYCETCASEYLTTCEECDDIIHSDHSNYSDYSENLSTRTLCTHCYEQEESEDDNKCKSFEDYTTKDIDKVLAYDCKPDLKFHTTTKDKNNLYLGIELELNFDSDQFYLINKLTKKYLAKKYIFKADGSIGDGAELVLAPMTYNALKEINFKDYFAELKKLEVTSYKKNYCGLHVHLSDSSLEFHNKVRYFFAANAFIISKFSMRDNFEFCKIESLDDILPHDSNTKRYSAINRTRSTNEIRVFRGTIYYPRFKASLIFCCALHHFLSTKSLNTIVKKPPKFLEFTNFLDSKKQYNFLTKYLNEKRIK